MSRCGYWLLLLFMVWGAIAKAQNFSYKRVDSLDRRPLVFINGKEVDPLSFWGLDKNDLEAIALIDAENAIKKFGKEPGKFGAVDIRLKPGAILLTWNEILKKFHFKNVPAGMDRQTSIMFERLRISDTATFVSSGSRVWGVSIEPARYSRPGYVLTIWLPDFHSMYRSEPGPLDKEIEKIEKIFFDEAAKRFKIWNTEHPTYIRG